MTKLTKAHIKARNEITTELADKWQDLEAAVERLNSTIHEAWASVMLEQDAYNEALAKARDWVTERTTEMDGYIENRSDKWQETDRGAAYQSWRDALASLDLEDIALDEPEEISPLENIVMHYDELDQIAESPE